MGNNAKTSAGRKEAVDTFESGKVDSADADSLECSVVCNKDGEVCFDDDSLHNPFFFESMNQPASRKVARTSDAVKMIEDIQVTENTAPEVGSSKRQKSRSRTSVPSSSLQVANGQPPDLSIFRAPRHHARARRKRGGQNSAVQQDQYLRETYIKTGGATSNMNEVV